VTIFVPQQQSGICAADDLDRDIPFEESSWVSLSVLSLSAYVYVCASSNAISGVPRSYLQLRVGTADIPFYPFLMYSVQIYFRETEREREYCPYPHIYFMLHSHTHLCAYMTNSRSDTRLGRHFSRSRTTGASLSERRMRYSPSATLSSPSPATPPTKVHTAHCLLCYGCGCTLL
jgi:hypothetical protein